MLFKIPSISKPAFSHTFFDVSSGTKTELIQPLHISPKIGTSFTTEEIALIIESPIKPPIFEPIAPTSSFEKNASIALSTASTSMFDITVIRKFKISSAISSTIPPVSDHHSESLSQSFILSENSIPSSVKSSSSKAL